MPGGLCRLTAGLSVLLQMPLVACHRPEWRVRPVCLCLKQWGLFPELEANLWQGQSMRLVHGHGIPTSLCMCILWDQAHQKRCASVLRPPIIVCVGTTVSAGLSVFVTLSTFFLESCCRHAWQASQTKLGLLVCVDACLPAYAHVFKKLSTTETRCIRATMPHVSL